MTDTDTSTARPGMFARLKAGLSRTATQLSGGLTDILLKQRLDADTMRGLEDALIRADLGAALAHEVTDDVGQGRYGMEISESELRRHLASSISKYVLPVAQKFAADPNRKPFVILVAGVNGTGKTTTSGKLAAKFAADGKKVWLAAADTFRAAAIDQLKIWGERARVPVFAREPGADAAGLAFDALVAARKDSADILLIDTAGRLHNKAGLMAELQKIARVLKKVDPDAPHSVLLVLDATTGQNAISQVEAFKGAVPLTGLIMTKLDGTAKGGILVALAHRFGLPIYFIGVGETLGDLQPFDAKAFATALTGSDEPESTTGAVWRFEM